MKKLCKYCGTELNGKYAERDGMCGTCKTKLPVVKKFIKVCKEIQDAVHKRV